MSPARRGYLLFLHRFQQRRLRLGRSAIDFVRENDIRKHGPAHKPKLTFARPPILLNHFRAGNIRWHQVRRELNPAVVERQTLRQRPHQQRLR